VATINDGARFFDEGDYEKAIAALRSVLSTDRENVNGWVVLGAAYYHCDQLQDAENCLATQALALDGANFLSHFYLGKIYEKRSKDLQSLSHYLKAAYAPEESVVHKEASERLREILKRHKVTPVVEDNPRPSSFGNEWVAMIGGGCAILVAGSILGFPPGAALVAGLYVFLFYVYIKVLAIITHIEIYSDKIKIRKLDISWDKLLTKEIIWLYQAYKVSLTRSFPNILTGDATVHVEVKIKSETTREKPGTSEEIEITGLGDKEQMQWIAEILAVWVKDEQAWLKRFLME